MTELAEIGLIGLGVMGSNLALNIAEKGSRIAVYNRTPSRTREFVGEAGALGANIVSCETIEAFVVAIRPPRPIIIMIKAGEAVDQQIDALKPLLAGGDIIIDAGNANFRDTIARFDRLKDSGLTFIGMGVSGGEEGARHGPSIMVGGTQQSYARVEKVLTSIAARYDGEPCCAWLGTGGAGHFVKTIHNGIEYADMQMIAEIYGILRDGLGKSAREIGWIFGQWNKGRLNSYLIEITETVLATTDPQTGKPMVDMILDRAGQKGTGKWSAIEAQQMGVPATAIEAAVAARSLSSMKAEREAAEVIFGTPSYAFSLKDGEALLKDLELALFAAKIGAYAQGFAVMAQASREFGWELPMPTIARIWRAGCIIRSQFLDEITRAFTETPDVANLIVTSAFSAMVAESLPSLRRITAAAVTAGIPVPALASALSYFDAYRQARGTANLIQAQRDFFGAHGFDRTDGLDIHHGPWGSAG
ncbi:MULTISPECIES: NADP-dependent phosphogluconate dehydrogenase [Alphaproteobacteria]|uniref:6-phosphogluconate dehydrogenase, decarboxylating n=2 Tax=Alphaproteobacteria TaxID=28211 RepID=A0A512HHX0_9HYPH|nr:MULTISPECIES: NADP-dependent phosphogluconate dehydrogenase [Alphaproteobacteria]GEO85041.1 6-phosphogluconate dehydrogenase, decarboxylating [Ciceribacter naphthalenivorans]GLR22975.1 6-phosphogluconate dehydrogenase, decarboxylating [Ciceribacter naphthalenivorans]GLT05831.1 6-phosphogluconate dehydrogenase, decarboxylating [Sphingomonas psychrolutea]